MMACIYIYIKMIILKDTVSQSCFAHFYNQICAIIRVNRPAIQSKNCFPHSLIFFMINSLCLNTVMIECPFCVIYLIINIKMQREDIKNVIIQLINANRHVDVDQNKSNKKIGKDSPKASAFAEMNLNPKLDVTKNEEFKGQQEGATKLTTLQSNRNEQTAVSLVPINTFEGNGEAGIVFYQNQILKISALNNSLNMQLRKYLQQKKQLANVILTFEEIQKISREDNPKRVRRCANEIQRKYVCTVSTCKKSYGTEGSMAQHMKLKHPEVQFNIESLQQKPNQKDGSQSDNDSSP